MVKARQRAVATRCEFFLNALARNRFRRLKTIFFLTFIFSNRYIGIIKR
jgi:hypothetical protein